MSGISDLSSTENFVSGLGRGNLFLIFPKIEASRSVQSLSQSILANSFSKSYSSPEASGSCSNSSSAFLRRGSESSSCSGDSYSSELTASHRRYTMLACRQSYVSCYSRIYLSQGGHRSITGMHAHQP